MQKISLVLIATTMVATLGLGQAKKPAPATCPVCKMALATKKSAANPTAVKLTKNGPTLYCCAHCKMPASVLVKPKKS